MRPERVELWLGWGSAVSAGIVSVCLLGTFVAVALGCVLAPEGAGGAGALTVVWSSCRIVGLAVAIAAPVGIGGGVYLAEVAPRHSATRAIRRLMRSMVSAPSVVYGVFGLVIFVRAMDLRMGTVAPALTLALWITPMLVTETERALRAVSSRRRDAALALGVPRELMVRHVVLPGSARGIVGAVVRASGRCFGAAAPLLMLGTGVVSVPTELYDTLLGTGVTREAYGLAVILLGVAILDHGLSTWGLRVRDRT